MSVSRWEIIHGDCLDVMRGMADRSVDHVITDPPYLLDFGKCITRGRRDATSRQRPMGYEPFTVELLTGTAACLRQVVDRWCLVFSDVESTGLWRESLAPMRYVRTGAWVRTNPCPQFSGDRPGVGFEAATICYGRDKGLRWNGGGRAALWTYPSLHGSLRGPENDHPTPKPLDLMTEIVADFTDPDDLILDPFCGSGTTGVACLRLGRRFIGIEKDAKYAALARERLTAEENGSTLSAHRAGQLPLLGGVK